MQTLRKQIEEQAVIEIAHMKKNFLDVVNHCKKLLQKHMRNPHMSNLHEPKALEPHAIHEEEE